MKIAFIGLGNMGGGMAANLAKGGHDVRAFDLSDEALARAEGKGCLRAASATEAVKDAEAVVTMLPAGKRPVIADAAPGSSKSTRCCGARKPSVDSPDAISQRCLTSKAPARSSQHGRVSANGKKSLATTSSTKTRVTRGPSRVVEVRRAVA